jgi:hypothetical protein
MVLIVKLADDYGSNYYGPFDSMQEATDFVNKNLAEYNGAIEGNNICIDFPSGYGTRYRHSIGRVIEINKDNFKPLSIKDGH